MDHGRSRLVYGMPRHDDDLVYRALYVDAETERTAGGNARVKAIALLPFTFDTETWMIHVQPGAAYCGDARGEGARRARALSEQAIAAVTHGRGCIDGRCPEAIVELLPEIEEAVWIAWTPPGERAAQELHDAKPSVERCLEGVTALAEIHPPAHRPVLAQLLGAPGAEREGEGTAH